MRRCQDWRRRICFAGLLQAGPLPLGLIRHRLLLLRRLGSTDPQLQRNTVVTLRLALPGLHGLLIRPGDILSIWRRVGRPPARRGFPPGVQLSRGRCRWVWRAVSVSSPI